MNCCEFRFGLQEYLAGGMAADLFDRMVEHEASCEGCGLLAENTQASFRGKGRLLPMTQGLRADRRFVRDVMNLTAGPSPRFLDVVRALWRRPQTVWEATLACTLLTLLLLGDRLPEWNRLGAEHTDRVLDQAGLVDPVRSVRAGLDGSLRRAGIAADVAMNGIAGAMSGFTAVRHSLDDQALVFFDWAERARDDVRSRGCGALPRELRVVLQPSGLIPPADAETNAPEDTGEPDLQDTVRPGSWTGS